MKYSELISIDQRFDDTFNITQEHPDYWKQFISNKHFEDNLSHIVSALSPSEKNQRKSFWVQGTYGTGKSHSTSVILHLLSDDLEEVETFLPAIQDVQIREQIRNFRRDNKIFPVVMRGVYGITDSIDMIYTIQNLVIRSLNEKGIHITTKSDVDSMIERVNDPKLASFWDSLLTTTLKSHVSNKNEIIEKLNQKVPDIALLRLITNEFKNAGLASFSKNIDVWLEEVKQEIDKQGVANYLMIFWDEFTTLLDKAERRSLLNTLQDIAEVCKAPDGENANKLFNVYIYIVTHKSLEATQAFRELKEDEKSMAQARFYNLTYDMQPNTAYHILAGAIKKDNPTILSQLIDQNYKSKPSVMGIFDKIVEDTNEHAADIRNMLMELYPFHPYTAYLSTYVSRTMGSAERSIFQFLNDSNRGFRKFLSEETDKVSFLTAQYVWDFFEDQFDADTSGKFEVVTNKYKMHIDQVSEKGKIHADVFKVILLLNILYRVTVTDEAFSETSLVKPKEDNIIAAFSGVYDATIVQDCLEYLDAQQVLMKSADGVFEVSFSSLPISRVQAEVRNAYPKYEQIYKVFDLYNMSCRAPIEKSLSTSITRACDVQCFWGGEKEFSLRNGLSTRFTSKYKLKIAVFFFRGDTPELDKLIGRSECSLKATIDLLTAISKENGYEDIVFVTVDVPLNSRRMHQFIENYARQAVAESMKMPEEISTNKTSAEKWIKAWKDEIITDNAHLIFHGDVSMGTFSSMSKKINESCVSTIFKYGLENLSALNVNTIWAQQNAKKVVETVFSAIDRSDLESSKWPSPLRGLLKDEQGNYVFDEQLVVLPSVDKDSPVAKLCNTVKTTIESHINDAQVNLSRIFEFLAKSYYGYYQAPVAMAAFSLAFRPYVNKIYKSGNGQLLDVNGTRDAVAEMFECWQNSNKKADSCIVRFSTVEERELVNCLQSLFGIKAQSLINAKWELRDTFEQQNQSPLWTLKYIVSNGEEFDSLIDKLFQFVKTTDDKIQQSDIRDLLERINKQTVELHNALKSIVDTACIKAYLLKCLREVSGPENRDLDLIKFLIGDLAEKKSLWEEQDVKASVYKWVALEEAKTTTEAKATAEAATADAEDTSVKKTTGMSSATEANVNHQSYSNGVNTNYSQTVVSRYLLHHSGNDISLKKVISQIALMHPELESEIIQLLTNYQ